MHFFHFLFFNLLPAIFVQIGSDGWKEQLENYDDMCFSRVTVDGSRRNHCGRTAALLGEGGRGSHTRPLQSHVARSGAATSLPPFPTVFFFSSFSGPLYMAAPLQHSFYFFFSLIFLRLSLSFYFLFLFFKFPRAATSPLMGSFLGPNASLNLFQTHIFLKKMAIGLIFGQF